MKRNKKRKRTKTKRMKRNKKRKRNKCDPQNINQTSDIRKIDLDYTATN
jgi:hypothetical protein